MHDGSLVFVIYLPTVNCIRNVLSNHLNPLFPCVVCLEDILAVFFLHNIRP